MDRYRRIVACLLVVAYCFALTGCSLVDMAHIVANDKVECVFAGVAEIDEQFRVAIELDEAECE